MIFNRGNSTERRLAFDVEGRAFPKVDKAIN